MPVHADNVVAVRLYLALRTQWRVVTLSTMSKAEVIRLGLDYGVVDSTARLAGLALSPDDFARLRILETEALAIHAEERRVG